MHLSDLPLRLSLRLTDTLAAQLRAEGYVAYDDFDADQYRVYRTTPPASVPRSELTALLRERATAYLSEVAAAPDTARGTRAAAADAAEELRTNAPGTASWLRGTFETIRDELPELTDEQAEQLRAEIADARPTKERPSRAAYHRQRRADHKDAALARASRVLPRWLARLDDGRHPLPELWNRWQAEVLPGARRKAPELLELGRNDFYAALADVAPVRRSGRTRYIVVQNTPPGLA